MVFVFSFAVLRCHHFVIVDQSGDTTVQVTANLFTLWLSIPPGELLAGDPAGGNGRILTTGHKNLRPRVAKKSAEPGKSLI